MNTIKTEPVLTWGTALAILNAIQTLAISMPPWAHTLIVVLTTIVAALAARSQVTPVAKPV